LNVTKITDTDDYQCPMYIRGASLSDMQTFVSICAIIVLQKGMCYYKILLIDVRQTEKLTLSNHLMKHEPSNY